MSDREEIVVCHLGRVAYEPAWTLQSQVQEWLISAKQSSPPEPVPHVLLLLEHPHVYTLGKSGEPDNLRVSAKRLESIDATYHHVGRGGDITYHGPGQLVGYPLFDLDRFFTDLGRYLRSLEEIIIRSCADHAVSGTRVDGRTGVWVGPDEEGPERKICAMGVRCSRWVTMHGFALNVNTDLDYFDHIVPCGIQDRGVTSLAKETGDSVTVDQVREPVVAHFSELFGASTTELHGAEARAFLEKLTGADVVSA